MNSPVVQPPTNTSSSSTGARRRTTDSKRTRFGSATEKLPKARAQLLLRQLPLTHAAVSKCVDQGQQLVKRRIFPCGFRHGLVQGFERGATHFPVRVWPYGRQIAGVSDLFAERRGGVRRRHAARRLPALARKRVLHAVNEELLDRLQEWPPGHGID